MKEGAIVIVKCRTLRPLAYRRLTASHTEKAPDRPDRQPERYKVKVKKSDQQFPPYRFHLYLFDPTLTHPDMRAACALRWAVNSKAGPSRLPYSASVAQRSFTSSTYRREAEVARPAVTSTPEGIQARQSIFEPVLLGSGSGVKPFYVTTPIFYVNACKLSSLPIDSTLSSNRLCGFRYV